MSKGRRAADRRRERESTRATLQDDAPDGLTDPGRAGGTDSARAVTVMGPAYGDDPEREFAEALNRDPGFGDVAEVTAVRERPEAAPRRGGKLAARQGPDAGAAFPLTHTPALVGRGARALVKLIDPTVSREHLELRFLVEDGVWIVEDKGSGSGTLLNGQVLEGAAEIKHGDLLHVGQTELRFSWDEALPEALPEEPDDKTKTDARPAALADEQTQTLKRAPGAERPPSDPSGLSGVMRAALFGALLVVLTGAGTGVYFAFFHHRSDTRQIQLQVEALLSDAKRLLSELKLEEAKARLDTVLALSPGQPDALSLMRMVESEMESRAALEEARALFEDGKLEEARKALMRIPDSSGFASERDRLRAAMSERERADSLRAIELLVDEERYEEALARLEEHLARWPRDDAARALRTRIEKKRGAPVPDHPVVAAAKRAFYEGNLAKARVLVEAESTRGTRAAQRYLADLDTFEAALSRGERRLKVMDDKGARPDLERAWGLLGRLGGKASGPMARRVGRPLANALYLDAMAKQQRGDRCGWAKGILEAHDVSPADPKVKAQKRAVDSKAKAGLLKARAAKADDPERARQIAREHLCFAPPRSSTGKALRRMVR